MKLFYVLREASRMREREGMGEAALKSAIAVLLERSHMLFGELFGELWTLKDLEMAYGRYWSEPANWWEAPTRWFDPLAATSETGGIFTNDVNRASSEFRNLHMYSVLARAALNGERVLAVVGRNHVIAQASALECALR